jgi:hypothetical protein
MALSTPLIMKAVYTLLATPTAVAGDTNRTDAAADLAALTIPVYVGSRPQGTQDVAITISKEGGPSHEATDVPLVGTQTAVDVRIWAKSEGNAHIVTAYRASQLIRVYLVNMQRTVEDVNISDCQVDGTNDLQNDIPPVDKSDNWLMSLSTRYLFTHDQAVASAVAV